MRVSKTDSQSMHGPGKLIESPIEAETVFNLYFGLWRKQALDGVAFQQSSRDEWMI